MTAHALPSWRETAAKRSIVEFAAAVTQPDSPDFVPEPDRVAVFDNDGTLWTEQPVYAQQPMLELLGLLDSSGFSCWIFSGGGTDFMRTWASDVYGLPPHRVIGSVGQAVRHVGVT